MQLTIVNYSDMVKPYMTSEERSDVFRGLANKWRRRVIDHLRDGTKTFEDLQHIVPVSQGTLSSHLGILRDCGLIETKLAGGQMSYRVRPAALKAVTKWSGQSVKG